jgi:hypothetical protein
MDGQRSDVNYSHIRVREVLPARRKKRGKK